MSQVYRLGKRGQGAKNQQTILRPPPPRRFAASLLDDWLRAFSSLKLRRTSRDTFFAANPPPWDDLTEACYHGPFSDKLDEPLDAAHGSCALHDPRLAQIVADRLHHFDGQRYDLWSYVITPNHVHVLFTLRDGESLPDTRGA